jgi:hypothetical protein
MPCGMRRRDESGAFPGAPSSPPHLPRFEALAPIASVIVISREHHLATRPRPRQVRDALGQVRSRALMTSGSGDKPLRRPAAARLLFRWLASASRGTNVRAEHLFVAPADHRYGDTDGQRASVSLGPKGLAVPPRPAKGRDGVQSPRCRLAFLSSGEETLPVASLSRARRGNQRAFVTPPCWLRRRGWLSEGRARLDLAFAEGEAAAHGMAGRVRKVVRLDVPRTTEDQYGLPRSTLQDLSIRNHEIFIHNIVPRESNSFSTGV